MVIQRHTTQLKANRIKKLYREGWNRAEIIKITGIPQPTYYRVINNSGGITIEDEIEHLKSRAARIKAGEIKSG